jgi:hypothetical protein
VPGLHRHVRPGPDGDPDVGGGQGRGIVHAVSHHGDPLPLLLEFPDLGRLVLGEDLCEDGVDPQFLRHRIGHGPGVAGEHGHLDAPLLEGADRLPALLADGVGHGEDRQRLASRRR